MTNNDRPGIESQARRPAYEAQVSTEIVSCEDGLNTGKVKRKKKEEKQSIQRNWIRRKSTRIKKVTQRTRDSHTKK